MYHAIYENPLPGAALSYSASALHILMSLISEDLYHSQKWRFPTREEEGNCDYRSRSFWKEQKLGAKLGLRINALGFLLVLQTPAVDLHLLRISHLPTLHSIVPFVPTSPIQIGALCKYGARCMGTDAPGEEKLNFLYPGQEMRVWLLLGGCGS